MILYIIQYLEMQCHNKRWIFLLQQLYLEVYSCEVTLLGCYICKDWTTGIPTIYQKKFSSHKNSHHGLILITLLFYCTWDFIHHPNLFNKIWNLFLVKYVNSAILYVRLRVHCYVTFNNIHCVTVIVVSSAICYSEIFECYVFLVIT